MSPTRRAAVRLLVIFIGYATIVTVLFWSWFSLEKENFTKQLDQKLLAATSTVKDLLAPDFHDRARTPTSISLEEELENRRKFNALKEALGLTWVYTVIRTDSGGYVFTAPSVSDEEAKERLSWYFYPYQEIPEAFIQALDQRGNTTLEYRDEWGKFRSFCRTELSPGGQPYLACADIDITHIETFTTQHLLITLGVAAAFLALAVPVGLTVRGMYREYLKTLQDAHTSLAEQEAILRTILENLPVGVAVVDAAERTVVSANPKLLEMLEAAADQVIGKACKKTVCTQCETPLCPILDGMLSKDPSPTLTTFSGNSVPVFKAVVPATLANKHVLVEVLVDISAQKRLEAELIQAKEAAEAAAQAKSRFLAVMSHELRTPLGNILGTLQILPHLDSPAKQKPMTESAQNAARALLTLLNDILDLAALEGKALQPSLAVHPIMTILSPIIQIAEPQARAKRLSWETTPHAGATHVKCDATLVRKAILHIVTNAIKFSARGTIRLESWTHGTGWYLGVHDTGPGIDPHLLDTIFSPFTQADMGLSRIHGGSGVGLGIASGIVRLLGGSICVDSEPGAGATFVLAFPQAVANQNAAV